MVDLHTHCLPKIDDGAKSLEESLALLKDAKKQGVSTVVATPHAILHREDRIRDFLDRRNTAYESVLSAIAESGEPDAYPTLLLGAEVFLDHDLSKHPELSQLCLGDSNYLLIEFPTDRYDPHAADWLYSLKLQGIVPLIAHVERYHFWKKLLSDTEELGTIYQVNASTFLSMAGRSIIKKLLATGNRVLVSSDMHNTAHRPCVMEKGRLRAEKLAPELTEKMFSLRANRILGI